MTHLSLCLLGAPRIERNNQPIRLYRRKAMALLAYLFVTGKSHTRDALATLLWPEWKEGRARAALRLAVFEIRNALGEEWLEVERESLTRNSYTGISLDVEQFRNLIITCRAHGHGVHQVCSACLVSLTDAVNLYHGDFMAGYTLRDSAAFDDWQLYQSNSLRDELSSALEKLICGHRACGEFEQSIAYAQRWTTLDPLCEPAQRCLIELFARTGQRAAAMRQYQELVKTLDQELGITPQPETTQLHEAIQENQEIPSTDFSQYIYQPDVYQIRSSADTPQIPFLPPPRPAYTLVGRSEMLSELKQQILERENVSIALYGLPGVGKTALAVELAHDPDILQHFGDGVLWTGLGRKPNALALLGTWAAALGIPYEEISRCKSLAERAWSTHAAVGLRRMLLVIDDAWQIDDVLAFKIGGPNCAYVITTRLMNVAVDFADGGSTAIREIDSAEGINLLMQLAPQVVRAEPEETKALVQTVGGLPLALVLIGRYLRKADYGGLQHVRQSLERLKTSQARLQLSQPQSPLEQHPDLSDQTSLSLQASISLSDVALDVAARRAWRNLSLFLPKPNTFSKSAALVVADVRMADLTTLADHGFLESAGPDRYSMHQTIADYARQDDADAETIKRLVSYFVQYVSQHEISHEEFDRERDNLLTAMELALEHHMHEEFVQGISALHQILLSSGLYALAEKYLSKALGLVSQADYSKYYALLLAHENACDVLGKREAQRQDLNILENMAENLNDAQYRAEVALRRAIYAGVTGDYLTAIATSQAAINLAQTVQDVQIQIQGNLKWGTALFQRGDYELARARLEQTLGLIAEAKATPVEPMFRLEAEGLRFLGNVAHSQGDYARALACYERALHLWRELGDQRGQGMALNNLGIFSKEQGDYVKALACYQESLYVRRKLGDRRGEGVVLHNLGAISVYIGDYAMSLTYYEQSLAISREVGDRFSESTTLGNLGLLLHRMGENNTAMEYSEQAARIAIDVGARDQQGNSLTSLGHALTELGQWAEATTTYQSALITRHETGSHSRAMDALAGLARISLLQGDLSAARAYAEKILTYLQGSSLDNIDEPVRVCLTCYRVLCAAQDPRAHDVLLAAHRFLQERAAKINDEKIQRSFLENVRAHRELIAVWDEAKIEMQPNE